MIGYEHSGYWQTSSADSYVEAHLSKNANSTSVTLDISKAIQRKATMTSNNSTLTASRIPSDTTQTDIKGHFHYDNLKNINNGIYVSYTNDRLVFL